MVSTADISRANPAQYVPGIDNAFGNGDQPGMLGTGMYRADKASINPNDFKDQKYEENRQRLLSSLDTSNQVAPQQAVQYSEGATINPNERTQAALSDNQSFNSSNANGAQINRQDNQFRNDQTALAGDLLAQSRGEGPSLGTLALKQGTDRALAGQVAAAQASRGNPALAARTAAVTSAGINQDAATQAAQIRMQEQQAARAQLAGVSEAARGQDIGVNTNQANLSQMNNQFNASADQNAAQRNAELTLQNQQFNAGQETANNQFNAANQNQYNQNTANMLQQNQQYNAGQGNQVAQNNLNAQLQNTSMNNQNQQYYTGSLLGYDQQQVANNQAYNQLNVENTNANAAIQGKAYSDSANQRSGLVSKGIDAIAGLSDRRQKKEVKKADSQIKSILEKLKVA